MSTTITTEPKSNLPGPPDDGPRDCPFYGCTLFMVRPGDYPPFRMWKQLGNRCGLITLSHSPCQMEIRGRPVDWASCTLIQRDIMVK